MRVHFIIWKKFMLKLVLKRLAISVILLIGMSFLTFWLMHLTPGSFFDSLKMNPQISQETIARYEKLYGLDKPLLLQYGHWLANVCRGEFGYSFFCFVFVYLDVGYSFGYLGSLKPQPFYR